MTKPFLILIDGPMGSGKTTTSKLLSKKLPDSARIALPDIKRLIPNYNENEKTLGIIREVIKVMIDKYLELGVSVIVEQITKANGAEALKNVAEKYNANFYAYRLTAPEDVRLKRVVERTNQMAKAAGEMGDNSNLIQSKIDEITGYFVINNKFYIDNPISIAKLINTQELNTEQIVDLIVNNLS